MIINERNDRKNRVLAAAGQMMTAARTAPKAKGSDIIEVAIVEGEDLEILSTEMKRLGQIKNRPGLLRDAENILRGQCVMLIGVRPMPMGLNCGHCGFQSCQEKTADVPCAFNSIDVGIAVGSACATAADLRLDACNVFGRHCGPTAWHPAWLSYRARYSHISIKQIPIL